MNYTKKLERHKKKTITKKELSELYSAPSDEALFEIIKKLEAEKVLFAVAASKTNGNMHCPIYMRYKINLPQTVFSSETTEIKALHPLLQNSGFLSNNPGEYHKYKEQIQNLSKYLFNRKEPLIAISRKERSFEIFFEEKQLDDKSFCRLLSNLELNDKNLYFYDTPEYCFNDYIPVQKANMVLLICENKDIWFNIRRMMFEKNASEIFNVHIDGVVYGCGNKISAKNALTSYTKFMTANVNYLYWGDIDRAGFNIYLSLIKNNQKLNVKLFVLAYEAMLELARGTNIPNGKDERKVLADYGEIFKSFSKENRIFLAENINKNKRIPQEIINFAYLNKVMR